MYEENVKTIFRIITGFDPDCCDTYITAAMRKVKKMLNEYPLYHEVRLEYLAAAIAKLNWLKNQRIWQSDYLETEIDCAESLVDAYMDMCRDLVKSEVCKNEDTIVL